MLHCPACQRELENKSFYRTKTRRGYSSYCKECTKKKSEQRRVTHGDSYIEKRAQYKRENSEAIAKYQKRYRAKNADKVKANNDKSNAERKENRLQELNGRVKFLESIISSAARELNETPGTEKYLLERLVAQAQ